MIEIQCPFCDKLMADIVLYSDIKRAAFSVNCDKCEKQLVASIRDGELAEIALFVESTLVQAGPHSNPNTKH